MNLRRRNPRRIERQVEYPESGDGINASRAGSREGTAHELGDGFSESERAALGVALHILQNIIIQRECGSHGNMMP